MPLRASIFTLLVACLWLLAGPARADLDPGVLFDFEDGTVQGWSSPEMNTTNVPSGGPMGAGDGYLEIAAPKGKLAAFNSDLGGVIDPAVTDIELDLMRPAGQSTLSVRLVLFGPSTSDRWTSTVSQAVPGDGVWRSHIYSILEQDLTQVAYSGGSYEDLQDGLVHVMFRHQSGAPGSSGTPLTSGVLNVDNIFVVPEPAASMAGAAALATLALTRRRLRSSAS